MKRVLPSKHEIERLDIDQDVGHAEREETEALGCDGMHGCTRTEVKWRDWHGFDAP